MEGSSGTRSWARPLGTEPTYRAPVARSGVVGTPRGAKASATCYSLIETAKANGLELHDYLRHLL